MKIALDGVEDDRPDHVSDVRRFIDGGPAQIHPHFSRPHRLKQFLLPAQTVVNAKAHDVTRAFYAEERR